MARILSFFSAIRKGRFDYLLVTLLLYLLLSPFVHTYSRVRFVYYFFLTVVLLTSLFAVCTSRRQAVVATILAVPMEICVWLAFVHGSIPLYLAGNVLTLIFLMYITISILQFVFRSHEVTRHIIFGAISVYLLIGISWSILYSILETLEPGSFSQIPEIGPSEPSFFAYFSYVTITTLGYGDITPVTAKAQSLAIVEALIGQIYMTVLIAWLVGLYVSRKVTERKGRGD